MRITCAALGGMWIFLAAASAAPNPTPDWKVVRHEGRDYLTLENVAQFYGFPAPAPLPIVEPGKIGAITSPTPAPAPVEATPSAAVSPAPPAPATPGETAGSAIGGAAGTASSSTETTETTETSGSAAPDATPRSTGSSTAPSEVAAPLAPQLPRTIALDSGKWQIEFTLNSREVMINGVKQWLAFPAVVQGTKLLISRLDLSRVIEPQLRPEMIQGFRPVTTIVLDAGHGGHDKGAVSRYGYEKDFALDVSSRARRLLEARGYKVAMTRTTDVFVPLHERARFAKGIPDSIFVSIHFNASSSNREARGFEIFSMAPRGAPATNDGVLSMRDLREEPGNANELQSSALAASIYHSLLGQVPMIDRGLKHARFAVLRLAAVPAVLVECGFVSNSAESALIGSPAWRERVAQAIVEGIGEYKSLAELKQRPKMMAQYRNDEIKEGAAVSPNHPTAPQ